MSRICVLLGMLLFAADCGPSANPEERSGAVTVFLHPGQPPQGAALNAGFVDYGPSGTMSSAPTIVGPCSVELECNGSNPKNAGTVSAAGSGGSVEIQYPYPSLAMEFGDFVWAPGSEITLAAAGGEVPAFSAIVHAPGAPTFTGTIAATTPRSTDLPLTWTLAAPSERFQAVLWAYDAECPGVAVCTFSPGDTSGSIPSAALMLLPPGQSEIGLQSVDEHQPSAGAWMITVRAATQAIDKNGETNPVFVTRLM
jgi:hypothetical protein